MKTDIIIFLTLTLSISVLLGVMIYFLNNSMKYENYSLLLAIAILIVILTLGFIGSLIFLLSFAFTPNDNDNTKKYKDEKSDDIFDAETVDIVSIVIFVLVSICLVVVLAKTTTDPSDRIPFYVFCIPVLILSIVLYLYSGSRHFKHFKHFIFY